MSIDKHALLVLLTSNFSNMKRFLFSLLWGAGIATLSAQAPTFQIQDSSTAPTLQVMMDSVFALTDLSGVSSGILADRGFHDSI